ncbi:hypothetical protein GPECTOR_9g665 [Gonium pectorale]|uniref:Uncharacterized protein n=1 Tax=Gonium pectorale TaxID=33097 RepID=A0A150GTE4_GONPE|nr:hypothetical protein GPECTOR_9g665 [Gonium pectorale]|eukprot:KXZ52620.1 hypothetical protein GPECTOR_9g665 [Gonium pectorale]
MNLAALGCHCLVARNSPWQLPLVSLDVAATACAAFCAAYACWTHELGPAAGSAGAGARGRGGKGDEGEAQADLMVAPAPRGSARRRHLVNMITWCGLINTSAFWGLHIPLMPELLYLGSALVAAVVVGRYVLRRRPFVGRQGAAVAALFGGAALAVAGPGLDAPLCRAGFGATVNAVTVVFVGCHVIMGALLYYVRQDLALRAAAVAAAGGGEAAGGA